MSPGSRFMLLLVALIVNASWAGSSVFGCKFLCLYDCSLCPLDRVVCLHHMYCNAIVSVPVFLCHLQLSHFRTLLIHIEKREKKQ